MGTNKSVTLQIVIAGDAKRAVAASGEAEGAFAGLSSKMGQLATVAAATFAVKEVVSWGKAAVDTYKQVGGEIAALKRITGATAQEASLLRFVAQQSGIPLQKLQTTFGIFSKSITNGTLERYGIQVKDAAGEQLSFTQILENTADAFASAPDGPAKTAAALKLFGRGGADLIKVLDRGRAGIEEMKSKMQSLGLEFDAAGLQKYKQFIASQRELTAAFEGLKLQVGEELVPALTQAATAVSVSMPLIISIFHNGLSVIGAFVGLIGDAGQNLDDLFRVIAGGAPVVHANVTGFGDVGVALDAYQRKHPKLKGSLLDLTAAQAANTKALKAANKAETDRIARVQARIDAERAVRAANDAEVQATKDLATARKEAAGDSVEYRAAEQTIADDKDSVVTALKDEQSALADLNQERIDAKQRIEDLQQAAEDAAISQEEAQARALKSKEELRRTLSDKHATAGDKALAQAALDAANQGVTDAGSARRKADQEAAAAKAAGVEGDKQVIAAKEKVADATKKVADAERQVGLDTAAAAQILVDAKAKEKDAVKAVEDAQYAQGQALGALGDATFGVAGKTKQLIDYYTVLAAQLDPSSPLRKNLEDYINALTLADLLAQAAGPNPDPSIYPRIAAAQAGGSAVVPAPPSGGAIGGVKITNNNYGTPRQNQRANDAATRKTLGTITRNAS